jgi:hypothetical protein
VEREDDFFLQLVEGRESKVSSSALRCLYHRKKPKQRSRTHAQGKVLRVSRVGLFAIKAVQHLSHSKRRLGPYDNGIDPPDEATRQGGQFITHTTVKGARESRCP